MSRRQRISTAPPERPTYRKVLDQAVIVLNEDGFDRFSVQRVLDNAEISRATLYRYFPDVDSLLEAALVESFRFAVDRYLNIVSALVEKAIDASSFREGIHTVLKTFSNVPADVRIRRAHIIALASTRPELATAIAEVQESLTHRWDTTLQEAARRGLIRDDIDTRAFGVIVQSITIGRIVDDAAINHLTNDQWAEAVFALVDRAILGPVGPTG
jgi:AcrR family transcriptional regulator